MSALTSRARLLGLLVSLALLGAGVFESWVAFRDLLFGAPEWELNAFGYFAGLLGLPTLGFAGLALLALSGRSAAPVYALGVVAVLVAVWCGAGVGLSLLNLPLVLQVTREVEPATSMAYRMALAKTVLLSGVYALGFLTIAVVLFRSQSDRGRI